MSVTETGTFQICFSKVLYIKRLYIGNIVWHCLLRMGVFIPSCVFI